MSRTYRVPFAAECAQVSPPIGFPLASRSHNKTGNERKCRLAGAHLGLYPPGRRNSVANPSTGTQLAAELGNWEQRENSPVGPVGIFFSFFGGGVFSLGAVQEATRAAAAVLGLPALTDCIPGTMM